MPYRMTPSIVLRHGATEVHYYYLLIIIIVLLILIMHGQAAAMLVHL